ncbi:hypothetical protein BKA70DRAFT_1471887 [Coprinopsis sp. MPI-PUGE-AT-0042]|nr:hypothetical protein BKA70DRAFT_1471887 [Coprinopsis sp. MPI-PUGE-AT-0042]
MPESRKVVPKGRGWENRDYNFRYPRTDHKEGQSQVTATSSRGAKGYTPITQSLKGIQVYGAPLNVVAGDVHNNIHHHYAGDIPRFPPGWDLIENHRQIHIATLGRATRGTGTWIRRMETWCIWLDPEGHLRMMWGYGMPGAGKTILASIVIDALEAHARASASPICVNYLYFRYSDHIKTTVRGLLEVLVKQTVERHPHCLPLFDKLFVGHILEKTQPSEEELLSLYQRFSGTMVATFCVLDAFDEAPPEIQINILQKLVSLDGHWKHAFPRRTDFKSSLEMRISICTLRNGSCSPDLYELVEDWGPSLRKEITTIIKEKCGGMFLHASLQLEALRECTSIREVKEALATFSTEIEGLYRETWKRITGQSHSKALLAKKVFLWVTIATRPLTMDELRFALASCPETHRFDPSRLVQEGTLLGLCRGLVTVEEETRLVRLVHYTAKNTLEHLISETFPQPHVLPSAVCLARLKDSGLQRTSFSHRNQLAHALETQPLLSYAYDSWSIHARQSLADPIAAGRLTEFVESCHAFPIHHDGPNAWGVDFDVLSPLHVVAHFNISIMYAGPNIQRNPNKATPGRATALHLACGQGHYDVVQELLHLPNILVEAADSFGTTALIFASSFGDEATTRLLLAHPDINVNAVGRYGWTALIWASENGRTGTVALLLSHPAIDVNVVQDLGYGDTALIMASEKGHGDVVALLLSHPDVDVNAMNWIGETALSAASRNGHEGVVKLLLSHPRVDVNAEDNFGFTPLSLAVKGLGEDVVRLLLAHPSIQVTTRDLNRAIGRPVVVTLLEEFLSRS